MSELSAETIDRIVDLARESNALQVVQPPGDVAHYLVVKPDKTYDVRDVEPKPRNHSLGDLDTVVLEAKRLAETGLKPVVWFYSCVVTILDDLNRRDSAKFEFKFTTQFGTVAGLGKAFSQKEFIRLLRIDLAGCLGRTGELLKNIRQLKFLGNGESTGAIQHGKESISRSTIAELVGADVVPEETVLQVRVFEIPGQLKTQDVRCAIEIDVATESFKLTPLPGELTAAKERAVDLIEEFLTAGLEDIPVVYGKP